MFENITRIFIDTLEKNRTAFEKKLNGTPAADFNRYFFETYTTEKTCRLIHEVAAQDAAALLPDDIKALVLKKYARLEKKELDNFVNKRDALINTDDFIACNINVEWKRSQMWGSNPTATVTASSLTDYERAIGKASGCGYDKLSACIAYAFNDCDMIKKQLWKYADTGAAFPYSVNVWRGIPTFDGGCGVGCFYKVFEVLGYEFKSIAGGRSFDVFQISKKGA